MLGTIKKDVYKGRVGAKRVCDGMGEMVVFCSSGGEGGNIRGYVTARCEEEWQDEEMRCAGCSGYGGSIGYCGLCKLHVGDVNWEVGSAAHLGCYGLEQVVC